MREPGESGKAVDWREAVRARLASARLQPQDEAEIVDEVAQHLEAEYEELASRIGAVGARARLLAAGVAALALGIGLTTVMFSIIYGLLIKGLPFNEAEKIATIYRADPTGHGEETLVPFGDYVRYAAGQRDFAAFGAYERGEASISGGDRPEQVDVARMTAGAFDVAGVRPLFGRSFGARDNAPDAAPTAVLSFPLWRDRFAGDSSALGKSIRVDGRQYAIIGVMPEGFAFPDAQQLWLPIQLDPSTTRAGDGAPMTLVAKLRGGVSYAAANAGLGVLSRRLTAESGDTLTGRATVLPFIRARMPNRVYSLLYAMLGAVFLVLLVACANVANLLLARAVHRTREVGIRLALGASRLAIVRQSLVESGILAVLAAFVGAALAQGGIVAFNRAMVESGDAPFWMDVRLHVPVLAFMLGLATIASIVSGLLPALHSARLDISTILKDESQAASSLRVGRLSRTLVVAEIAVSSAMLLAAGFMTKSIVQLRAVAPRFTSAGVFTARVNLPGSDTLRQRRFFEDVERGLAATAGLDGIYLGNDLPGTGWSGTQVAIDGKTYPKLRDYPFARTLAVSPGFFSTFGVEPTRGRAILPSDRATSARVALVSEAFVRRQFPDVDPIGKRIRLRAPDDGDDRAALEDWVTIVGVIPSLYAATATSASGNHFPAEVLTAFWQQPRVTSASIALRGPAATANAATLRKVIAALDADVPIYAAESMEAVLAKPLWPVRVFGSMFVIFGVASLVLAAVGLYAAMAFSVSRRVREMGIRMALGATSRNVLAIVCRQGAVQLAIGMSIGLFVGAGLVRLLTSMLFEVKPGDPVVFAAVVGVLGGAALMACIVPAVKATRVDAVVALKAE